MHPNNLSKNLPVNYNAPQPLQSNPDYNKNLFSIPLQPDLYTTSQVNQNDASMSNLGISIHSNLNPQSLNQKQDMTNLLSWILCKIKYRQNIVNIILPTSLTAGMCSIPTKRLWNPVSFFILNQCWDNLDFIMAILINRTTTGT